MKVSQADHRHPRTVYDRQLLLFGVKRDAVLDLWEVERYGLDSFADADYVSVYGMRPADWLRVASGCWGAPPSSAPAMPWPTPSRWT